MTDPHDHDHDHDHDHGHDHGSAHRADRAHSTGDRDANVMGKVTLAHGSGVGRVLHLDCFSGIAGDMLVAALLDLGVPREAIDGSLSALGVGGYRAEITTRIQSGIVATRFVVTVEGSQPDRRYRDVRSIIEAAPLIEGVRARALAAFAALAGAEARVHRMPVDDVHFHEVGAVDAIVDVVAASAALEWLGARVTCSPLPMGRGFVRAAHGVLPVPAPAVVEILTGAPTIDADVDGELVTPTGASLAKANARAWTSWPSMRPMATGFGAGTRSFPSRPNLLRVVLGDPLEAEERRDRGTHVVIESNIDDASGQLTAHVTESLLREGALDAWTSPIGMKKGRPGFMVSALAHATDRERVGRVLLEQSSALGLRWRTVDRTERPRRTDAVETRYGVIPVKVAEGDGIAPMAQPEFDVCRDLAQRAGVPTRAVHAAALAAWWSAREQPAPR